jgi:hypothetical protein
MSAVIVRTMPDGVLAGTRERLLAMVDILEAVPPEDVRALALRSTFARLDAREDVLIPLTSTQGGCSCCWKDGRRSTRRATIPGRS